jgi:hypothetical protein
MLTFPENEISYAIIIINNNAHGGGGGVPSYPCTWIMTNLLCKTLLHKSTERGVTGGQPSKD